MMPVQRPHFYSISWPVYSKFECACSSQGPDWNAHCDSVHLGWGLGFSLVSVFQKIKMLMWATLSSFKTKVLSFLELLERTNSNKTCHNLLLRLSFAGVIPMPHLGRLWPLSLLLKDRMQGTTSNSSHLLWCRTEVAETSSFRHKWIWSSAPSRSYLASLSTV